MAKDEDGHPEIEWGSHFQTSQTCVDIGESLFFIGESSPFMAQEFSLMKYGKSTMDRFTTTRLRVS